METVGLLDKLEIENRDIVLEFLVTYSRFEYALKKTEYIKKTDGDAEVNWETFISKIKMKFNPNKNKGLSEAVNYLLKFPAKKQIVKNKHLCFEVNPSTKNGPEICRLYHCIRITRNNLFHGGKFYDGPEPELSRNKDLIKNSLLVLNEILELDDEVKSVFWKIDYR